MKIVISENILKEEYNNKLKYVSGVLALYNKANNTNYYAFRYVGSGEISEGYAVQISLNKIIKLTKSPDEAATSFSLIGKNSPILCEIYDVFKYENWYCIIQQLVKPINLPEEAKDYIRYISALLRKEQPQKQVTIGAKKFNDENLKKKIDEFFIQYKKEIVPLKLTSLDLNPNNFAMENNKLVLFDLSDYTKINTNNIKTLKTHDNNNL